MVRCRLHARRQQLHSLACSSLQCAPDASSQESLQNLDTSFSVADKGQCLKKRIKGSADRPTHPSNTWSELELARTHFQVQVHAHACLTTAFPRTAARCQCRQSCLAYRHTHTHTFKNTRTHTSRRTSTHAEDTRPWTGPKHTHLQSSNRGSIQEMMCIGHSGREMKEKRKVAWNA